MRAPHAGFRSSKHLQSMMDTAAVRPFLPRSRGGVAARILLVLLALLAPRVARPAAAQAPSPLDRIAALDVKRLRIGRMTVLYSGSDTDPDADLESAARRTTRLFADAGDFFAGALDGEFTFGVALLSPRDWARASAGAHAIPWSSRRDRLVVVPVRADMGLLTQGGQDTTRARQVLEIIELHQLGHVLAGEYLYPAGFDAERPPVLWFEELLASYFGEMYMRARKPELANFAKDLAEDVVAVGKPRFTSLQQLDAYYDGYLTSPQGANTLGWYQNAFNLRAAELYEEMGPDFIRRVRSALPWARFENWTTDELLEELEEISPGFIAWADEMAERTRRVHR